MNRRILLLRLDAIGDFILSTAVLPHMRSLFEKDHVTLVVNSNVAPLATNCPYVDEVWHLDPARYAGDREYVEQVSEHFRGQFDIAINLMYTRTWQSDNILARTHAPVKIGFQCLDDDGNLARRRSDEVLYTTLVKAADTWEFELARYASLLAALGVVLDVGDLKPEHWTGEEDRAWATSFVARTLRPGRRFALLCPGAGFDSKRWPDQSFAAVADWLIEKYGMDVVIGGSAADKPIADAIRQLARRPVYDATGMCTLKQFAALTSLASLYVGIDTAGFHFAWTNGIPSVAVFGGGHFGRFIPDRPNVRIVNAPMDCYRCYWHCIYDEVKCITAIQPALVISTIESVVSSQIAGVR